jgi:hypothetical protein
MTTEMEVFLSSKELNSETEEEEGRDSVKTTNR